MVGGKSAMTAGVTATLGDGTKSTENRSATVGGGPGACLLMAAALVATDPGRAHHSFATHYMMGQSMEITGLVTEVSLRSPHSFYTLEVMIEDGAVEWEVEAHAIPLLRRLGIDSETIRPGDTITVEGPPPRGTNRVTFGSIITLVDGRQFSLLGGGLSRNLSAYRAENVDAQAGGAVLQRMSGRWGVRTPPGTQVIDESPLPLNEAGLAARAAYDPLNTPAMDCIAPNLPSIIYAPYVFEIRTGGPGLILFYEYEGIERPLSFTEAVASPEDFGRRTARIEADALVIESTGFSENPAGLASDWDRIGRGRNMPGSAQKRFVERYTASDDGTTLVLDYTLEDPVYLSEPFTARVEWDRLSDDAPIYDFDCDADIATRSTLNAVPL